MTLTVLLTDEEIDELFYKAVRAAPQMPFQRPGKWETMLLLKAQHETTMRFIRRAIWRSSNAAEA